MAITLQKQVQSAIGQQSASYDGDDCVQEDTSLVKVDWKVFEDHITKADDALETLLIRRQLHEQQQQELGQTSEPVSRFGFPENEVILRKEHMEELATKMNAHHMESSMVDWIVNSQSFQDCFRLTHDQDEMAAWFNHFVVCDEDAMTKCCHTILRQLLVFLEHFI